MLTIHIHNDGTGTDTSANYDYTVLVNDGMIARGRVRGHDRKRGWMGLLCDLLSAEMERYGAAIELLQIREQQLTELLNRKGGE